MQIPSSVPITTNTDSTTQNTTPICSGVQNLSLDKNKEEADRQAVEKIVISRDNVPPNHSKSLSTPLFDRSCKIDKTIDLKVGNIPTVELTSSTKGTQQLEKSTDKNQAPKVPLSRYEQKTSPCQARAALDDLFTRLDNIHDRKNITDKRFAIYKTALEHLSEVIERNIPETIVWPRFTPSEILAYRDLMHVENAVRLPWLETADNAKRIQHLVADKPEADLIAKIMRWIMTHANTTSIVSKVFARNLLALTSSITTRLIEIGAGSAMLSSALNEQKEGSILMATDKTKPTDRWKNVRYQQIDAITLMACLNHADQYKKILYLSLNPTVSMLETLIDEKSRLFLINIGCLYLKKHLAKYNNNQLKLLELEIPGFSHVVHFDNPICLLAINMPEEDYQTMASKIPERFLKSQHAYSRSVLSVESPSE